MIHSLDSCSNIKQFLSLIVVASITKFCWIVVSEVLTIWLQIKRSEAIQMELYTDPITVNCRKVLADVKSIGAPYSVTRIDNFSAVGVSCIPLFDQLDRGSTVISLRRVS